MDTIFALATARGKAGVAIIRISGTSAFSAAEKLCGVLPRSRGVRSVRATDGTVLDEALVLRFEEQKSFTGEAVVELHLHGAPAIVSSVLKELGSIDGLRIADAGEFTRRALENGRLDLAQVEGLGDLIDAETEIQRQQAFRVFSGSLTSFVDELRSDVLRAVSLLEATIDFADEDVPVDVFPEVGALLSSVSDRLRSEIEGVKAAERIRDGFVVAIVGSPNVGKSTLLNRLAGREAAITSEVAGTTRDVIEVQMDLEGLPVTLLDTAGLRATQDKVEAIGIERAISRAQKADLRVFLVGDVEETDGLVPLSDDIVVRAKGDLGVDGPSVSGKTGEGVEALIEKIVSVLAGRASLAGAAIKERHREGLSGARAGIQMAQAGLEDGIGGSEMVAEDLWRAVRALDSVVGRIDVEHVLGEIFSSFCIGK